MPELADPRDELVRIEVRVPAVHERREGAVLERKLRCAGALGGPCGVPRAHVRVNAGGPAACEQPDDVDLVRALTENHATALGGVELLGTPRPVQKIRVIERRDHPRPPVTAASDDFAGAAERGIETMAM